MKQIIEYYYSMEVSNLVNKEDDYYFEFNNNRYLLTSFFRDPHELDDIIICLNELSLKGMACDEIVRNIFGEYLTKVGDNNLILIKKTYLYDEIPFEQIIDLQKKLKIQNDNQSKLLRTNWTMLWSNKIDYIETQTNILNSNKTIHQVIDYYIGLTENAISYVNRINQLYPYEDELLLAHRRINYKNISDNFFNPLNFVFDSKIRDIAEYVKSKFFANPDEAFEDLKEYLKITPLTQKTANLFFARLLYPSYFFDEYEKIINKKKEIDDLLIIIDKCNEYEQFLKRAYNELSLYTPLEKIAWLK